MAAGSTPPPAYGTQDSPWRPPRRRCSDPDRIPFTPARLRGRRRPGCVTEEQRRRRNGERAGPGGAAGWAGGFRRLSPPDSLRSQQRRLRGQTCLSLSSAAGLESKEVARRHSWATPGSRRRPPDGGASRATPDSPADRPRAALCRLLYSLIKYEVLQRAPAPRCPLCPALITNKTHCSNDRRGLFEGSRIPVSQRSIGDPFGGKIGLAAGCALTVAR